MIKQAMKQAYMRLLFCLPHNNIYEFHHVSREPAVDLSPRKISTEGFREFVERHGPYLPLTELTERRALDGSAAITFDDGLEDVYTVAYPFLAARGIPFTAFLLSDRLDQPGYLTRAQALELARSPLVTIGSHGASHVRLSLADEAVQRAEIFDSKAKLEALLGMPCETFAYPFGMYSAVTRRLVREAGYKYACAVRGRPLLGRGVRDPFAIPRLSIDTGTLRYYGRS